MREIRFETGSVTLNVARGPASGPPLILLHGVTRRWQDFLPLLPALSAAWEVHALDFRGHGRSDPAGSGAYRVIDYVPDVLAYLREGVSGPAVVLGHSLGSMVAAAVATRAPERVRGLILEDPTFEMTGARVAESGFLDLFQAFQPLAGSPQPTEAVAATLAESRVGVPGRSDRPRLGDLRDPVSLRFSASCLKRLDPEVLTSAIAGRWLDGYDVPATLGGVRCPTLMLQGEQALGGALPDDYAAELARHIPGCLHLKMPGVGHNIHAGQAEAMLRLVLPFLASLD